MSDEGTSAETAPDLQLEIAHLLLIDVVGYSKLLLNQQIECLQELNQIVRSTECFQNAEKHGRLIRLPTGDGMALVFFRSPEEPARCALEISRELKKRPYMQVRMGIHSGPVSQVKDVNETLNIAGAGINVAQRVKDCGDAGHILVSKHVADDLAEYKEWRPCLRDIGEYEAKHGLRLHLFNFSKGDLGNPNVPEKLKRRPRWPIAAALLVALVALAASMSILFYRAKPRVLAPEKSIAVLPFENLSDEKQNAFFAEGIQDEILTNLARVADLKVISRTSVMQYQTNSRRNLREIARALGVAYVLEGSVQRAGDRVKVAAQLIDARTDSHTWADKYERALKDVFAIQTEVAEKIVDALKSKLSPSEKAAIEQPATSNLAAYDLYLRAKTLIANAVFSEPGEAKLLEAIQLLDQAVRLDPLFFLAYYQLAHGHDQMYQLGFDHTPARLALADAAIKSLRQLHPDSGETHLALAKHLYWGYLDYDRARQELKAAQLSLPNDPVPFLLAGYIDRRQGHWEESTRNMERALELDPQNLLVLHQMSLTYENLRRYPEMAAMLDRALALQSDKNSLRIQRATIDLDWRADPHPLQETIDSILAEKPSALADMTEQWLYLALCQHDADAASRALAVMPTDGCTSDGFPFPTTWCAGLVARLKGDAVVASAAFTKAREQVDKIVRDQPNYAKALCALGMIDAALGRKTEASEEGRRALELLPVEKDAVDGALLVRNLAIIYAWSGQKDPALEQLATAAKLPGYLSYGQLHLHPLWDPLRDDPRFDKIVASLAPK